MRGCYSQFIKDDTNRKIFEQCSKDIDSYSDAQAFRDYLLGELCERMDADNFYAACSMALLKTNRDKNNPHRISK